MVQCKGVIFDLDGVITGTAKVHALAWKSMFDVYLKERSEREGLPFTEFTEEDYLLYVDGRPRMQGVSTFLQSRGIELPFGSHEDVPGLDTVCGLGNSKNVDFQRILRKEGPEVYASSVEFIKNLKQSGIRVGVASSSRNCQLILELAGLEYLFETRVDGDVSLELGLSGKPNPDIFVTAAANLGLLPGECVVVEDAISGVQAGRAGNFGLILGLAREVSGQALLQHGADIVVTDLGEISVAQVKEWFATGLERDAWTFGYTGFEPENEKLRETLTTVGNGYLGVRGALETERAGTLSYPGTYLAGIFNKTPTRLHGRDIYNNDLVNCPNWLLLELRIGKGAFVSPFSMNILSYRHELCMKNGSMHRDMVVQDQLGRIVRIHSVRFASMAHPHLLALRFSIEPVNFSAPLTLRSCIDGNITNDGVPRYRALNQQHLEFVDAGKFTAGVFLHVQTTSSQYQIVMAARNKILAKGKEVHIEKTVLQDKALIAEEFILPGLQGVEYTLEKTVCVHTSRDTQHTQEEACKGLLSAGTWRQLFQAHTRAWRKLWQRADITIQGDRLVQQTARLHSYHLLITASVHNAFLDVGMPARGLSGEAYRGHIFWDEVYILPFYDLRLPEVSQALLAYRYNRLEGAREYAQEHGYLGAMYPWQTADGGEEETQEVHYNPKDDTWGPDLSRRQRHVSIAVFYNVWRYIKVSCDDTFLKNQGAELMLSIAQFWASIAQKDQCDAKYHIEGVMGPDEFHERAYGSVKDGVRDNAYTNVMVSWLLKKTLELLQLLPVKTRNALQQKLALKQSDFEHWAEVASHLNIGVRDGIIEQFEGYFDLQELDWEAYRKKYGDIHRLDRILKAEGDSPDKYKLAKQADTLMAFYLLHPEQVKEVLADLNIDVGDAARFLKRNYEYYEARTSHGSTLSKVVHAVISAHFGDEQTAWQWFMEALLSDIHDTQGGTTPEGIHTGVMAGTLDIITKYFAGIDSSGECLAIDPHLPSHFVRLKMPLRFRRVNYLLELTAQELCIKVFGAKKAVTIMVQGQLVKLKMGEQKRIAWR